MIISLKKLILWAEIMGIAELRSEIIKKQSYLWQTRNREKEQEKERENNRNWK
jgi:hypothetical protein